MRLKNYQQKVLDDLDSYLNCLRDTPNPASAYKKHWNDKSIPVGGSGLPVYQDTIQGVPHICMKVPTGGGKTFLGVSALGTIFKNFPKIENQLVVWLVPSNAILEQTITALKKVDHPYRDKLNRDFSSRVEVYTKEELLQGQNFNPSSVREQLSLCILSYDSLRSNKKDGRNVYKQNSQLAPFVPHYTEPELLLPDVDETALMQVLNQLSPVVVVDESHNAESKLSVEMLQNLNPSLVLDLTATPKNNSNIISFVDARELKKEHMVKLPVIVYNRAEKIDVLKDAIHLRGNLEGKAKEELENGGQYIRPIVLFQAQSKGKEDATTFQKLKSDLIEMGIPEEEIAIKTSDINEIKGVDLLSKSCKIRYIITVNALKEGWDCPFAYILATVANKTSRVDVEQIVGRVLRQPYTKQHSQGLLNNSYVLTCSNTFTDTLDDIVKGLNRAGFSRDDMRTAETEEEKTVVAPPSPEQIPIEQPEVQGGDTSFTEEEMAEVRSSIQDIGTESAAVSAVEEMVTQATEQQKSYDNEMEENDLSGMLGGDLGNVVTQFQIKAEFREDIKNLKIPLFVKRDGLPLFGESDTALCEDSHFSKNFTLEKADVEIDFNFALSEAYSIDLEGETSVTPKYKIMSKYEQDYLRKVLATGSDEKKIEACVHNLYNMMSKIDTVEDHDLRDYIHRIVKSMNKDELAGVGNSLHTYAQKIKEKIKNLETIHRKKAFFKQIDTGEVFCQGKYCLPSVITVLETGNLGKTLYEEEASNMNKFELKAISAVASLSNVKWWHRVKETGEGKFQLNGFINHAPDFMVMTNNGVLILMETKGDFLANAESEDKLKLGRTWEAKAGTGFQYFMVYEHKEVNQQGAYVLDEFIGIVEKL